MVTLRRPSPGNMNQGFGPRPKPTPTSPATHYGQDYGWGNGDQVTAAAGGIVTRHPNDGAYGNRIAIRHDNTTETWYCHLSRFVAATGTYVMPGEVIGYQGDTGNVTAKHLHFELRVRGVAVDPEPYFTHPAGTKWEEIMAKLDEEDRAWIVTQLVSLLNQTKKHVDMRIDYLFTDTGKRELSGNISLLEQVKQAIHDDPDVDLDDATLDALADKLREALPAPSLDLPAMVADEIDNRARARLRT